MPILFLVQTPFELINKKFKDVFFIMLSLKSNLSLKDKIKMAEVSANENICLTDFNYINFGLYRKFKINYSEEGVYKCKGYYVYVVPDSEDLILEDDRLYLLRSG